MAPRVLGVTVRFEGLTPLSVALFSVVLAGCAPLTGNAPHDNDKAALESRLEPRRGSARFDHSLRCPRDVERLSYGARPIVAATNDPESRPLWIKSELADYELLAVHLYLYPNFTESDENPAEPVVESFVWTPAAGPLPSIVDVPGWGSWELRVEVVARRLLEGGLFELLSSCQVGMSYGYLDPRQPAPLEVSIRESQFVAGVDVAISAQIEAPPDESH
ncbi:MAG: hypothetical protein U0271_21670 [Polyangiaceae bacterium]